MTLILHEHPFAAYCQKVRIALFELDLPFETHLVDGEEGRAEHMRLWPIGGMPVLRDTDTGLVLPESAAIVEHLDRAAGGGRLIPADPDAAFAARRWERIVDAHLSVHMQNIVGDVIRPADARDPYGVEQAKAALDTAYGVLEAQLAEHEWVAGATFTLADCAAAPVLFYLRAVHRWDEAGHPALQRYARAVLARPSVARTVDEARPYRELFPLPWPDDIDTV